MRDKLMSLLKIVVSIGLIALVFSRVPLAEVGKQLASASLWYLAGALLVYMLAMILNGVKWHVLLRAQGVDIPLRAVVEFQFVGFFFNNFLPSASLGGDVMRGYGLARYTDRTADAAVSVIVDRIVGFMAYMSSAAVAALIAVNVTGRSDLRGVEWAAVSALTVVGVAFAALLSRRLRALVSRVSRWRVFLPLAPTWERISTAFNSYRFGYRPLAAAFGVALLGMVCSTIANWLVSQSMGGLMALLAIMLFTPLIALVLTIPISIGGIGVSQTAYPFFFGLVGVPANHAVAVSLLMQLLALVGSLPGGLFWLRARPAAGREPGQGATGRNRRGDAT